MALLTLMREQSDRSNTVTTAVYRALASQFALRASCVIGLRWAALNLLKRETDIIDCDLVRYHECKTRGRDYLRCRSRIENRKFSRGTIIEHLPVAQDMVRALEHIVHSTTKGFGSGLARRIVELAVDVLERRGFAVYGTQTAIERLNDLGERLTRRMDEAEDRLTTLSSEAISQRLDDPAIRATFVEAIAVGAEVREDDCRTVLADLVVERLLTDDAAEAIRQRRAIEVIRVLDGRRLRLVGAIGALLYPNDLVEWPPIVRALEHRDPGEFELTVRAILQALLPEDPARIDLETLVELGLVERDRHYQPYGVPSFGDSIQSFLLQHSFPMIPPMESALNIFYGLARARQLLMPRQDSGLLVNEDGRGFAGYRLLPLGYLISRSVCERLLVHHDAQNSTQMDILIRARPSALARLKSSYLTDGEHRQTCGSVKIPANLRTSREQLAQSIW